MTRIRLRIGETWDESTARLLETMRRAEAGEITEDCDSDYGFPTWEYFATVLKDEAPELAAKLLAMPEADRFALFDAPAGQEILQRLWARSESNTGCPD